MYIFFQSRGFPKSIFTVELVPPDIDDCPYNPERVDFSGENHGDAITGEYTFVSIISNRSTFSQNF